MKKSNMQGKLKGLLDMSVIRIRKAVRKGTEIEPFNLKRSIVNLLTICLIVTVVDFCTGDLQLPVFAAEEMVAWKAILLRLVSYPLGIGICILFELLFRGILKLFRKEGQINDKPQSGKHGEVSKEEQ